MKTAKWSGLSATQIIRPLRREKPAAPFAGQVQDLLSAIYFLRTQPLTVGKSFEVTVSDSGRVYQVPVQVLEKKRKKTVLGTSWSRAGRSAGFWSKSNGLRRWSNLDLVDERQPADSDERSHQNEIRHF